MYLTSLFLSLQVLVTTITASHFYGGLMTFNSKMNIDGSYEVELRFKATYHHCNPNEYWACSSGDCGFENNFVIGQVDSSINGGTWCQSEGIITRTVYYNNPFDLLKQSCCWIYNTVTMVGPWSLLTHIDLGVRSDTSEPNKSPVTTTLPFLRVPQNCPRRYKLLAFDPDGDHVRCRYGLRHTDECGICNQPAGFTVDQENCSLSYVYTWLPGVYSFELVMEDFSTHDIALSYNNQFSETRTIGALRCGIPNIYQTSTTATTTTSAPTTTTPAATSTTTTPAATTTTPAATTTTPAATTTTPAATTTTPAVTTTTPAATTTTSAATTTTPATTTTTSAATTTTSAATTTTSAATTTTSAPTTTTLTTSTTQTPTTTTQTSTTTETTTTAPTSSLSKIPLQFSLQVDGPAPSCTEGEYLPRFVHPTPHHGEHLQARVNQELEIRIKAVASFSSIIDVIFSGPLYSTKHKTTTGEYVINWTPTAENYDRHFPFCFIAEGQYGSNIYQSEMRCVIVKVEAEGPKAHVACLQNSMSVAIEKSTILKINDKHLRLIDPSCWLQSNNTHVFTSIPLNSCGTEIEENDDELIFKNKVISSDDPTDIITRNHELEIELMCKYQKRSNITFEFDTHRPAISFTERGFGLFSYEFEFYHSANFINKIDPNSYPLEYEVGEMIYMQIQPVTPVQNTEIFLESCVAAPYDNPKYPISYPIITNGCIKDETVQIFSDHQPYVQFGIEAFKFIGLYDQVFISCSIIICEANNPSTRCSQGCTNNPVPPPSHHHHKRGASIQTASHFISQGPLRLKSQVTVSQGVNLNLVVIAACLLAAVGMVCGVVVYRSKMSKIRYQPLPSHEL